MPGYHEYEHGNYIGVSWELQSDIPADRRSTRSDGVSLHYKQDFAFSNCLLDQIILTIIVLTLDTLLTTTQP